MQSLNVLARKGDLAPAALSHECPKSAARRIELS